MVAAIVYESNTGFTKEYARLLGGELGLLAFTIKEAEQTIPFQSPVVFLGWICAGKITGYEKAARNYKISAVCGVGLRQPGEAAARKLALDNRLGSIPFFYLQGGFEKQKLGLFHKMLMGMMEKGLEKKAHLTVEEVQMQQMIKEGADCVSIEQLYPAIHFLKPEDRRLQKIKDKEDITKDKTENKITGEINGKNQRINIKINQTKGGFI